MTRHLRLLLGIGLPVLTIVTLLILLSFSMQRLSTIEKHLWLESPHNMLWVISQAQIASLHLANATTRMADGSIEPEKLQQRYQVFLSRLHLMKQGPQRRQMERLGFADKMDALNENLPTLEKQIHALTPNNKAAADTIRQLLSRYTSTLGHAATMAMTAGWDELGEKMDTARNELEKMILLMVGILLAGLALFIYFLLAARQLRQHALLLGKEKAFSELVIGSSEEAIIAMDLDRRCTVWNQAAEQLFLYHADTAIGQTMDETVAFFRFEHITAAMEQALTGTTVELFDQTIFPNIRTDSPRYLDIRCFPLRQEHQIMGCIIVIFDVTERREAQREIALHRDHLEQLVQDRTQELNAALEREHATLELYRNFGAMVSHQFRTPLAIVDSTLQRLARRSEKLTAGEIRTRSDKARHAITRLTLLIESTLDAARLDTGEIEMDRQPCDLTQLATTVCELQRSARPGRAIHLTTPSGPLPSVHADPTHVEHILTNLIANALKYSQPDTSIAVAVYQSDGQISCSVTNQGSLPDDKTPDSLFERYCRGDNAKGHTGVGIGLYMARALARLQGGDIELVADEPGNEPETVTFILGLHVCPKRDTDYTDMPSGTTS